MTEAENRNPSKEDESLLLSGIPSSSERSQATASTKHSTIRFLEACLHLMPIAAFLSVIALFGSILRIDSTSAALFLAIFALSMRSTCLYAAISPKLDLIINWGIISVPFLLMPSFDRIMGTARGRQIEMIYEVAAETDPSVTQDPSDVELGKTSAVPHVKRRQALVEALQRDANTQQLYHGQQAAKLRTFLIRRHDAWVSLHGASWLWKIYFTIAFEAHVVALTFVLGPLILFDSATALALSALDSEPNDDVMQKKGMRPKWAHLHMLMFMNAAYGTLSLFVMVRLAQSSTSAAINSGLILPVSILCTSLNVLNALNRYCVDHQAIDAMLLPSAKGLKKELSELAKDDNVASYVLARTVWEAMMKKVNVDDQFVRAVKLLRRLRTADVQERMNEGATAETLSVEGYVAMELKPAFATNELKVAGYSAEDLRRNGTFSASELKANFSASELREGGFSFIELKAGGYTCVEVKAAGCSCAEAKIAGYSCPEVRHAGYVEGLKAAGYTCTDAKAAGYVDVLKIAGYTCTDAVLAGCTCDEVRRAGYTCEEAREVEFDAKECRAAGYDASDCKSGGFDASECAHAGFSVVELGNAGFSPEDIRRAAGVPDDLVDAWDAGFDEAELVAAGFQKELAGRLRRAIEVKASESLVLDLITPETASEVDEYGRLPLHIAAQNRASEAVVRSLLAAYPEGIKESHGVGWLPLPQQWQSFRRCGLFARMRILRPER